MLKDNTFRYTDLVFFKVLQAGQYLGFNNNISLIYLNLFGVKFEIS